MRIDAHQHFWHYDPAEYPWIGEDKRALRRSYLPTDLEPLLIASRIDRSVAVQARESLDETRWLIDLCRRYPFVAGVVGWIPLLPGKTEPALEELAEEPELVGVREILQGTQDSAFFDDPRFHAALDLVAAAGLAYDVLIYADQLEQAIALADRHPGLRLVVDHLAKPNVARNDLDAWAPPIKRLAERPHVCCKLSGLATEADWTRWNESHLLPYLETALEAFGPDRCMFGSDWPVCLVATDYGRWANLVERVVAPLSSSEQKDVLGETARRVYGLP